MMTSSGISILTRKFMINKKTLDIFLKAHNIFSGSQYTMTDSKNPQRWIEIGVRFRF